MFLKAVGIAIVAITILGPLHILNDLGFFRHYFKHHPGTCKHVKGLNFGSEDFQILSNGMAFVTSGFLYSPLGQKYMDFVRNNDVKGRIYAVDLTKSHIEAKDLTIQPSISFESSTFRPHGISVFENNINGQHLLYVVNHCDDKDDRIEKFRYLPDKSKLVHLKSFSSEHFHLTNDLALTGEDKFYISDYLFYKSYVMSIIEQAIQLRYGSILYYNGTGYTSVATGLFGPNGIILSKDKKFLYVPHSQDINVYEIQSDSSLRLVQEITVHTSVDNLHLSQDGKSLFGGCQPIEIKIIQHLYDPKVKCPSQVIKLPLKDGRIEEDGISQIFYDHGDLISASTTASIYNKKLLIGSVMNKLVVCDLP